MKLYSLVVAQALHIYSALLFLNGGKIKMKTIFMSVLLFMCSLVQANEVELDSQEINLSSNIVTLIRDARTPDKVKLSVPVPLTFNVCVRYDTRVVFGQHESCGYDTIWRWECRDVCVRSKPCDSGHSSCGCIEWENRCGNYPTNVMRSCYHPETYCAEYGQQVRSDRRKVTISFKDAKVLSDSEQEKFNLSLVQKYQDGTNADLSFADPSGFYEVQTSEFLGFKVDINVRK